MKIWTDFIKGTLAVLVVLLSPTSLYAHDTEIFFAQATADNEQNEAIANVMILIDMSSSMRWCQRDLNSLTTWCTDHTNRRINMLQNALRTMLDDVPEGVRIGMGRFNRASSTNALAGGRVTLPVTEVTPAVRQRMLQEIESLNSAGEGPGANSSAEEPYGYTPTAMSYAEMARYMLGLNVHYGTEARGAVESVCYETELQDVDCVDVFDRWGDYQEIEGVCNPAENTCNVEYSGPKVPAPGGWCDTALEQCSVEFGAWEPIQGTCDVSDVERCKKELGQWGNATIDICDESLDTCRTSGWSAWTEIMSSGANILNCPNLVIGYRETRRNGRRCSERNMTFQERAEQYFSRQNEYYITQGVYYQREAIYRTECGTLEVCTHQVDIKKGDRYVSPMNMENQCETNHIIIFTDGAPTSGDNPGNQTFVNCSGSGSYACQIAISSYLSSESNSKGRPVKTYNIGLYMGGNQSNMERVSTDGADGTVNADDADALVKAFADIINLVSDNARTFSSPGVAINQMNRLEHLDQLYYAVFEPRQSSYWDGNIKRYRLDNQVIRDANSRNAVDPDTAFFHEDARSFWSAESDGPDVRAGGAREQLEARKLFYSDASGVVRQLDWDNDNDPQMYGLNENATEEDVDYLKTRLKTMWGDPLHSQPILVNYGGTSDNNTIFISGNDGMLRAIDSRNGREFFSFMPHVFMRQANRFTVNRPGLAADNTRQLYGLDGSWTAWRRPGATPSDAPSAVYIYGGMRRGGTSYYALNVTNRNNPSRLWQIDRGNAGFERLGQTWSQPTLTQVRVGGEKRPVLVFGGGYSEADHDRKQGAARAGGEDEKGNMLYIVDAVTGNLLWSAGRSGTGAHHTTVEDMRWAVPSAISVVDKSFDGVADHLYFGDLGGQVWRVDLDNADVADSSVHKLANLSGGGPANNRRFYYAPAVAYVKDDNGQDLLYVTIGSGYRAHPLDESVNDYFFAIKDSTAMMGGEPETVEFNQLSTLAGTEALEGSGPGWKIRLPDDGEKVTAQATVFDGHVFFTSYQPGGDRVDENPCAVRMGTSHLYVLNLVSGVAGNFPGVDIDPATRRTRLEQDALAPTPAWITDGENMALVIGTEVIGSSSIGATGMRRGSWYPLEPQEADLIPAAPE